MFSVGTTGTGCYFNHINFLGYINPYVLRSIFILFFPVKNNTCYLFIGISFLLGLTIDIFSDSGGIHAAASVFIAYIRPSVFKILLLACMNIKLLNLIDAVDFGSRLGYIIASC